MWTENRELCHSRWWLPGFSLFIGLLMFAAFWLGGDPGSGAICLGVMAAVGALFLFGGRSETLRGLGGPGRDERWASIDMRATAFAGGATIVAIIVAFLVDVASGGDGNPYAWLGAVAGVAYVAGVALLRWRS